MSGVRKYFLNKIADKKFSSSTSSGQENNDREQVDLSNDTGLKVKEFKQISSKKLTQENEPEFILSPIKEEDKDVNYASDNESESEKILNKMKGRVNKANEFRLGVEEAD